MLWLNSNFDKLKLNVLYGITSSELDFW